MRDFANNQLTLSELKLYKDIFIFLLAAWSDSLFCSLQTVYRLFGSPALQQRPSEHHWRGSSVRGAHTVPSSCRSSALDVWLSDLDLNQGFLSSIGSHCGGWGGTTQRCISGGQQAPLYIKANTTHTFPPGWSCGTRD